MIGEIGDDHAGITAGMLGDADGEIVGLAAGAGEHGMAEMRRKRAEKSFRVVEDDFAEITRVGVERGRLPRQRLDDTWMAMPDRSDVVVGIEILATLGIVEPDAAATHEMDRAAVEGAIGRAEQPGTALEQRGC